MTKEKSLLARARELNIPGLTTNREPSSVFNSREVLSVRRRIRRLRPLISQPTNPIAAAARELVQRAKPGQVTETDSVSALVEQASGAVHDAEMERVVPFLRHIAEERGGTLARTVRSLSEFADNHPQELPSIRAFVDAMAQDYIDLTGNEEARDLKEVNRRQKESIRAELPILEGQDEKRAETMRYLAEAIERWRSGSQRE